MTNPCANTRTSDERPSTPHHPLVAYLTPRFLCAAAGLLLAFVVMGVQLTAGVLYLAAGIGAFAGLTLVVAYPETALLIVLLSRPILGALPKFDAMGNVFGIEGVVNLLLCAGLLFVLPLRRRQALFKETPFWAMACLLGLTLISLLHSTDLLFGARQWIRFLGYFVFFWIAYTANAEVFSGRLRRVLLWFAVIMLGIGVLQFFLLMTTLSFADFIGQMLGNSDDVLAARLNGFQDLPHTYARLMMICVCAFLAFGAKDACRLKRAAWNTLGVLCLFAIILTGVRSVLLATVVGVVVVMLLTHRFKRLIAFGLIFMAMGFGTGVFQARLSEFFDPRRTLEWNPLEDRKEIWSVIDEGIALKPFMGYGLGSVEKYVGSSPKRGSTPRDIAAHCDYRKFAFEAGLPAGVLFALMFAGVAWRGWRQHRLPGNGGALSVAAAGMTAGLMIVGLVDALMQDYTSMSVFWVIAGAALGWRQQMLANGTPQVSKEEANEAPHKSTAGLCEEANDQI